MKQKALRSLLNNSVKEISDAGTPDGVPKFLCKKLKNEVSVSELSLTQTDGETKTLKIKGMMCGHCEARVKQALESLEGVEEAKVSHEAGTAVVILSAPVDEKLMKQNVEKEGYKVLSIK